MTYSSTGLIQAADYNGFASTTAGANVDGIWGTGATDKGWGQTNTLGTVSAAAVVTAVNWSDLCTRITSLASHTGTAITSRVSPTTGTTISILAALNTDLTSCTTNRGNAAGSGTTSSTWTGSIAKTSATTGPTWTITWTQTVTFPSAAQARYFWNAGGLVRLDMSKTADITADDAEWNTFIGTVGTLFFSGRVNSAAQTIGGVSYTGMTRSGGSGSPSINSTTSGWYALTPDAAATTVFRLLQSVYPYSLNDYMQVTAAVNAASTVFTLVTTWYDSSTPGRTPDGSISGGTDTASPYTAFGTAPAVLCRFVPPSTTYLTDTWGTPVVASSVA